MSLAIRIVITILIELAVALLFGFREKKQLQVLAVVNIVTQIVLNVLLKENNDDICAGRKRCIIYMWVVARTVDTGYFLNGEEKNEWNHENF